jgi:yeast amino acid transporter
MFSYTGMEFIAATAAESKALANAETMKLGSRKISIRIVTLYSMAMLMSSCVVPRNHPFINGGGQSAGSQSLFIIAAVEAGIPNLAHFFNAFFVFCALTSAISCGYVASRVLHMLALHGQTGPEWITKRLQSCRGGVPVRAVFVTGMSGAVSYTCRSGAPLLVSLLSGLIS